MSKHDAACLERKATNPYLCTCGMAAVDRPALDPRRVETAMGRARLALSAAKRYERQAAAERAKIAQLERTWGFVLDTNEGSSTDEGP